MDDQRPTPKRPVRFSIRDLFWLTLVVALVICWLLEHREKEAYRLFYIDRTQQEQRYRDSKNYGPLAENDFQILGSALRVNGLRMKL